MHLKIALSKFRRWFFLLIILGILSALPRQVHGEGHHYLQNFSPRQYNNQAQNWAVLQDKRGIIYTANQGGIMEFDGVSWRLIPVPNREVRSIAIDNSSPNGTIYIGGKNEIGFLKPNSYGTLQYVSLLNHLKTNRNNFANVWETHATTEGIYFFTSNYLFRWNGGRMKTWKPEKGQFKISFWCNGTLFIHQRNVGLMQLRAGELTLIPGSEKFASAKLFMMTTYDSQRILIGTRSKGFYLYDGDNATPFPTLADSYLKENNLCSGIRLHASPGQYAMATRKGGIVTIDSRGRLKSLYNKTSGIRNNNVKSIFEDSTGNLWLALNNGITVIEYASPISTYDDRSGLRGLVLSVLRHGPHKQLYAGTTSGLFILKAGDRFQPVPGISDSCFSLLSRGDNLLAATSKGIYLLTAHTLEKVITTPSFVLCPSRSSPNRIWAGTRRGLSILNLQISNNSHPQPMLKARNIENINGEIRSIAEDENENLWVGIPTKGVIKLNFSNNPVNPRIQRYNTSNGLPDNRINIFWVPEHVIFATGNGIYRFDESNNRFISDPTLGREFSGGEQGRGVFRIATDLQKNIWFHSKSRNFQAMLKPDGMYTTNNIPFLRIPLSQVNAFYPDGNMTWFASVDGLLRYDTRVDKNYRQSFSSLVRRAWLINDQSVIFNGYRNKRKDSPHPLIAYKERNIRFEFAAPFFEAQERTRYQFFLDGYDNDWSQWTDETQKDYTNLDGGFYTFRVRAKNLYEQISKESSYPIQILPPWYHTWWAYVLFVSAALLSVFLLLKWRSRSLLQEKQRLETIIHKRTHEIELKNNQLESQSQKLKEMDTLKSRFFANISHEFRTPLTLIMGPLEQILDSHPDGDMNAKANLMMRSSKRLLNLVNQLLELARLDSGKMKLLASQQNIVAFVKSIVMCFESLAAQKKVELIFQETFKETGNDADNGWAVYFDPEKLEKIISNLLSNAFKYTPAGGEIRVSVVQVLKTVNLSDSHQGEAFPHGCVEIIVQDTGTGIPGDRLPYIFDRFYQVESSHEHKQKGSGIGLALSKELVLLHHGQIDVQSSCREGHTQGSRFIVRLPLGNQHLKADEIDDMEQDDPVIKESRQNAPEYTGNVENPDSKAPLVLVVEDNPDVRLYIKGLLQSHFNVVEAAGGKEGILRAKEILPDIIICDIMMPGCDGYQLCRRLKKDILTCHIPIILLTAKVSEESTLEGLEAGADDYITKPFSAALLEVRIRNLMELRRHMQLEQTNRLALQPGEISVSPIDDEFYKKILDTVETHMSDPDFNVEALSRVLQIGQTTLYKKIQALTGKTPTLFIRSYRLKRASQLLVAQVGNVAATALEVGFVDASYFAKCFKEQFHRLPSEIQSAGANPAQNLLQGVQPEKSHNGTPQPAREVILVVEDNSDARNYIRQSLEPGYQVIEAANGIEGRNRAGEIIPDLIISDIIMPGCNGYELCRSIKNDLRTSHIPVLLLTAKASGKSIIQGLETGADDYITKPFNMKILRARIRNLIRLRSHLQKKRQREMTLLPVKISGAEIHRQFMDELNEAMEKNLSEPEFNVEGLAKALYMSRATLYRKIQAITGEIPSRYIRSYRLGRAAQLLKNNFGSVTEVAFEVGFASRAYFARCFKEKFHQLPSLYMSVESPGKTP